MPLFLYKYELTKNMKLSRHLLTIIAIMATGAAQAGYVTPTTIWKEAGEMTLGSNPDNVPGYTLDVKDGDTDATVTKGGTTSSGLFVRDGKLTIGGTDEHITLTINPNGGGQLEDFGLGGTATVLNVAGKDAVAHGAHAGKLVGAVAAVTGGKGGGRPDNAMAGGRDASQIDAALAVAKATLEGMIK